MAPPDPLHELRERIRATQDAAERLARDGADRPGEQTRDELDALVALLRALRDIVPPELQQQLAEVIRQVLLLLRAVIDFWMARLEAPRPSEVEVQDIPID
jgi:predicted DNA-binding transcriptional regulator YafY